MANNDWNAVINSLAGPSQGYLIWSIERVEVFTGFSAGGLAENWIVVCVPGNQWRVVCTRGTIVYLGYCNGKGNVMPLLYKIIMLTRLL